eukprot:2546026-Amphidinium_carterae.1
MAHAPSLAHLDGPTQELLRLAITHGYNCACHGAAAPALPPTELNLPTPALVHTLTQSPVINIHSAACTDVAPDATTLAPTAILAAHETACAANEQSIQAAAFLPHRFRPNSSKPAQ